MRKLATLIIFLLSITTSIVGQQKATTENGKKVILNENGTWIYADTTSIESTPKTSFSNIEFPKTNKNDVVISHAGFSLVYNEEHEQAAWVAYELTAQETQKAFERTDRFIIDPIVKTGSANDNDYAGSGYDRGHLAPASDMGWSAKSMAESFYYSNMSPQTASFNRGIWKKLEEQVRSWAIDNDAVYVVTGPVLTSGLPTIGANKVSVPNYYYKVILDYRSPSFKGIGFIMANSGSTDLLYNYAVSIDSVEKFTGLDFFPALPDEDEEQIERTLCKECWSWDIKKSTSSSGGNTSSSVQCNGTTKAGVRCNNKTLNESGYCHLHESQSSEGSEIEERSSPPQQQSTSVQCSGTTKAGTRCKHMTYNPNGRCHQHGGG